MSDISPEEHGKKFADVLGLSMAYVELGPAKPEGNILFLHGNPTSSYLWRNIMPHVSDRYRCIAPDLIGMGDSEKLPDPGPQAYRFVEHRKYLDVFIENVVGEEPVFLVIHDWGSALGFDWAKRHPERVLGICFMEAIVAPVDSWDDWPEAARGIFQAFRSKSGEDMILEKNLFIEAVLPGSILRSLSEEEMAVYRRPFENAGEDRRPTLTWPRQIPIAGEPEEVVGIVSDYSKWLSETPLPKLFINAEPGAILLDRQRQLVRGWKNVDEVTVKGSHFIQEDSPHEIGSAISTWVDRIA